jgi:7-keto-8-aminopelargonate synthetase-like enzyme
VISRLVAGLQEKGVLVSAVNDRRLRAALHAGVDDEGVDRAARAFESVIRAMA